MDLHPHSLPIARPPGVGRPSPINPPLRCLGNHRIAHRASSAGCVSSTHLGEIRWTTPNGANMRFNVWQTGPPMAAPQAWASPPIRNGPAPLRLTGREQARRPFFAVPPAPRRNDGTWAHQTRLWAAGRASMVGSHIPNPKGDPVLRRAPMMRSQCASPAGRANRSSNTLVTGASCQRVAPGLSDTSCKGRRHFLSG
jgi:hypothetical protein